MPFAALRAAVALAAAPRTTTFWPGWMNAVALRWLALSSEAEGHAVARGDADEGVAAAHHVDAGRRARAPEAFAAEVRGTLSVAPARMWWRERISFLAASTPTVVRKRAAMPMSVSPSLTV